MSSLMSDVFAEAFSRAFRGMERPAHYRNTPLKRELWMEGFNAYKTASACPYDYHGEEGEKFCYLWWMDGWESAKRRDSVLFRWG